MPFVGTLACYAINQKTEKGLVVKTVDGNYVVCGFSGKICYTEREAGLVINGCKRHVYVGNRRWAKSAHGNSKSIPRRKYYCKD